MKWRFHTFQPAIFRLSDSNNLSCLVLLRKPCFFHVKNTIIRHISFGDMIHKLSCEYLQTLFCCFSSHTLDHLRGSSCQKWVSIHESIQPSPLQTPCQSIQPTQTTIDIVSFKQYHVSGQWISLTLHLNYPINQVRLHFKRQNRIRSRALFIDVLPLSQCPPGKSSSGDVG